MSEMIDRIVEADEQGNERWFNSSSQLHRDGDLPAVIYASGTKEWFKDGLCHRAGGPAVVWFNESKEWWTNGVRENDPVNYPNLKDWASCFIDGVLQECLKIFKHSCRGLYLHRLFASLTRN